MACPVDLIVCLVSIFCPCFARIAAPTRAGATLVSPARTRRMKRIVVVARP